MSKLFLFLAFSYSVVTGQSLSFDAEYCRRPDTLMVFFQKSFLDSNFAACPSLKISEAKTSFTCQFPTNLPVMLKLDGRIGVLPAPSFLAQGIRIHCDSVDVGVNFLGNPQNPAISFFSFTYRFSEALQLDYINKSEGLMIDAWEDLIYKNATKQKQYLEGIIIPKLGESDLQKDFQGLIRLNYFSLLLEHSISAPLSAKSNTIARIPAAYTENLPNPFEMNPGWLNHPWFRRYLMDFVYYKAAETGEFAFKNGFADWVSHAFRLVSALPVSDFRHFALAKLLKDCGSDMSVADLQSLINILSGIDSDSRFESRGLIALMEKKLAQKKKEKASVKKGDNGPADQLLDRGFEILDTKGRNLSLDQFKGQVVYVDFWASWCGPCRQQFPYSRTMKEKLSDKQKKKIVFLYISIDDKIENWKKAIDDLKIDGEHGISPGGWSSEVCRKYGISSIPRYMIIGRDGKIIDENAPRPSDPDLLQRLIKLTE